MTDTFDTLIDNVVESAKECENEHEHRGFYTESIKKNHDAARSALRAAIDEVVAGRESAIQWAKTAEAERDALMPALDNLKNSNAELERKLAEAEKDIRNLEQSSAWYDPYNEIYTCPFCESTSEESPEYIKHEAHCSYGHLRARLAGKGQG